jgi:hypothetical protein
MVLLRLIIQLAVELAVVVALPVVLAVMVALAVLVLLPLRQSVKSVFLNILPIVLANIVLYTECTARDPAHVGE